MPRPGVRQDESGGQALDASVPVNGRLGGESILATRVARVARSQIIISP
jgi:hypothetical protein